MKFYTKADTFSKCSAEYALKPMSITYNNYTRQLFQAQLAAIFKKHRQGPSNLYYFNKTDRRTLLFLQVLPETDVLTLLKLDICTLFSVKITTIITSCHCILFQGQYATQRLYIMVTI